ncbi:DUF2948 family protein [Ostreiculturibacter nitratireducens]|uniref:DUF2948 family protein n=1 Tax=Ostreiculturibacter nitratireducens TaxID=3075226 RepID=UPI0031B5D346
MSQDARFEDGAESALHLKAFDADSVAVISALIQDAIFPITEIKWEPKARRLSLLLNRFRWEDRALAERQQRPYERVRSVLAIGDVTGVASQGINRQERDTVLSLLSVGWEPGDDGTGRIVLTLAGDGAIRADVECVDLTLRDVTKPYAAPSRKVPGHPE